MKNESNMKRRMKALSMVQRRKYGIPTSDTGIDLLTGALLMSLYSNVSESHDAPESFSGAGGDFGGAGASDSWDDNSSSSSSSSSDSSYSSDSSSSSCGGD